MKLEHSKDLVLFCAKFFKIKSAVTNNTKSGFHRIRLGLCLNCTLTNSNFSHGFVCGSLDYKNLLSSQSISKTRVEIVQKGIVQPIVKGTALLSTKV